MNTARSLAIAAENQSIEASQQRAIAASKSRSALETLAARLSVSPSVLQQTLMATVFKGCSNSEFVALVIIANAHDLNPLLREIYAFPKKGGGIQAIVGYDGWIKIANNHPQFDGIEFLHVEDDKGNLKAIEGVLYRKDRKYPTKKMVYLREFKRNTDPWNNAPAHMLDVRCFCQTVRLGLGVSLGVEGDEDFDVDGGTLNATATVLPDRKSIAEELDDGIPDFDKETGEVHQTDNRGMTEVDEETARRLDANDGTLSAENPTAAEGRADEDHGEAHDEAEGEKPLWQQHMEKAEAQIAGATSLKDLNMVDDNWQKVKAGIPDEIEQKRIDGLIAAKRRQLRSATQEG